MALKHPSELAASPQPERRRAALIGGGVIGGGWAARFLLMGWDVAVFDPDPEAERKLGAVLENARAALPRLYDAPLPPEGRLRIAGSIAEAAAGAEWIQESAPERLEVKRAIYREIEAAAGPQALIGSSTSGFKPSELQVGAADPARLFVAHPFNPVYLLPLVELVGSDATPAVMLDRAAAILDGLGMRPLKVRREIDAHIADRLLEAVWREGLWLVHDGVATTEEIDDAIRFGFGLRWAQMGLFETYRIAGGEAGMRHFLQQFGPALKWPWTKLMDTPELSDQLIETIAAQSDAQAQGRSVRELERARDANLVAMMRALKGTDWGAGRLLNAVDGALGAGALEGESLVTIDADWLDGGGAIREARLAALFESATEACVGWISADIAEGAAGRYAQTKSKTRRLASPAIGDRASVATRIASRRGAKLRLAHALVRADGTALATGESELTFVCAETREVRPPSRPVARRLTEIARAQASID